MDNINTATAPNNTNQIRHSVTLSAAEYAFYQNAHLELLSPQGQHLEYVGKVIQQDNAELQTYNLRDQVTLMACLLSNIQDEIQLPLPAVMGLSELFYRMQGEWKKR